MNDKLDDRRLLHLRGQDPVADARALSDALAESAELYNLDGRLHWLNDAGELVQVTRDILLKIKRTTPASDCGITGLRTSRTGTSSIIRSSPTK
jgi:hypothetical protein